MKNTKPFLSIILFSFLLTLSGKYSVAQVLTEGFEAWPPANWTLEPASGTGAWLQDDGSSYGPGSTYEGEFAAMFNNYDYTPDVTGAMISPAFDISNLDSPLLRFYWWNNDAPLEPARIVVQSSNDGSIFISLDTIYTEGSGATEWVEYFRLLPANASHVKLIGISDYGLKNTFIDALSIEEAPSCLQPSNLTASNVGSSSADIDWTIGNNESAWTVEYGLAGFELGTGEQVETDSHPVNITELLTHTIYDFYVKANCDDGDSPWAGPLTFTTNCAIITSFPWEEGFENNDLGCFQVLQNNAAETWYWTNDGGLLGPYAGEGYARIAYSLSPQDEWMISPVFDFSATGTPSLIFYWSMSYIFSVDPNDNYDLIVKITTDGENWINIWDESMVGVFENWVYYEQMIDLQEYQNEEYFQFAFNYVGTDGAAAYLDEITLDIETNTPDDLVNKDREIEVFPNPVNDFLNIHAKEEIQEVRVYNLLGQILKTQDGQKQEQLQLSMESLKMGSYYVEVETERGQEVFLINKTE